MSEQKVDRTLTIYKASAGSGKTYTLALEYIKLLLGVKNVETGTYSLNSSRYCGRRQSDRHRHILAITFTNKATEEMKERIVSELHALASHTDGTADAAYALPLMSIFGCTREELREVAMLAMEELLYDYGRFNVSTIDSFFQQVLREFAREVDRQGDFEVELDDAAVVGNGVSMMLDDLNYGKPENGARMQRWIYDYMLNRIRESGRHNMLDRSSGLFASLVEFVGRSCSEDYKEYADSLMEYLSDERKLADFRKRLRRTVDDAEQNLCASARDAVAALESEGFAPEALNRYLLGYIRAVQEGNAPDGKALESGVMQALLNGSYDDARIYAKGNCPTSGKGKNKIVHYPSSAVGVRLEEFAAGYDRAYAVSATYRPTLVAADNLEFLGFALRYIEQFRRENNLILLSDTNDFLGKIISDDDAPFIYERMGVVLNHYLIDEFQDTSRMQWNILRPLVSAGVGDRHDSLIIGDEKQAIYRFRNSDSSMLHRTVAECDFPGRNKVKGGAPGENTNYRSAPGMVRFNNTVFERMASLLEVPGFENVVQTLPDRDGADADSYISFIKVADDEEALSALASDILRQHESGYEWRDIAVLVRGNADAAKVVDYLRENHPEIKVLSEEALYLRNSSSVKLIMGMLKLLDRSYSSVSDARRRTDKDSMAVISRFDYYMAEGLSAPEALHMALGDEVAGGKAAEAVNELRGMHASSLGAMVEMIVRQRIPAAQRKREMAFICAFQDMVSDYCRKYPDSVHDFVKWYDKIGRKRALPAAPDVDAVQVMTVHKSKGLEWACVHIPFANWSLTKNTERWFHPTYQGIPSEITPPIILVPSSKVFGHRYSPYRDEYLKEMDEQRTDSLNTTYVAFTRAAKELIVHTTGKEVGSIIESVLTAESSEAELSDGLHVDTAGFFATPDRMEIGTPTVPDQEKARRRMKARQERTVSVLDDYEVYDRDDTRELVAMPDITVEMGDIGAETVDEIQAREIVDPLPDDYAGPDSEQRRKAAQRGTLLHAVMAEMKSPADLDRALGRVANAAVLDSATTEELRGLLVSAFEQDDPRVERWFDPHGRLLSEQSILMPDGSVLRPDRIVIHADGSVDLVDYKFTSSMRPSHQRQLRDYCLMLRGMGYKRVRGHLWYPLLGRIASEKIDE